MYRNKICYNTDEKKEILFSYMLGHSNTKENEIADKVAKDVISNPLATSVSSTRNKTRRNTYHLYNFIVPIRDR